jgi:hypothetical protein
MDHRAFPVATSNYCFSNNGATDWGFNGTNAAGCDFVADVCSEVSGKYP